MAVLTRHRNWVKASLLAVLAAAIGFATGWVVSAIGTWRRCEYLAVDYTFPLLMSAAFVIFYVVMILIALVKEWARK